MYPYIFLGITFLIGCLAYFFGYQALNARPVKKHFLFLSLSIAAFVYLYGAWVFVSVGLKYVYLAIFLLLGVVAYWRGQGKPVNAGPGKGVFVNYVFSALLAILVILYFSGTVGKPIGTVKLEFPFRKGTYFVFQGGYGLPTNAFHFGLRGALFAMDLVKLNASGNRAKAIFSSRLSDYEIYGDTVLSPCAGVVQHTADNNPDNIPPAMKRGPTNTNHVLIETPGFYVFLGHMGYKKVFVHMGDSVRVGQPLGLVGNSGFSVEPHLHIQVHIRSGDGRPWYRQPTMLIQFYGKSYLLFEEIRAGLH